MPPNKATDASVLYGAIVPLLGIGLCLPLSRCNSVRTAFVLGLAGAVALVPAVIIVARIAPGLPRNIRIGLAAFIGAGTTIIAGMAAALLPTGAAVPYLTAVPFVIAAAVLVADAPLPEPKKKTARTFIEALITGLGFAALLCILGGLRQLIERSSSAASGGAAPNPATFFVTVPGALILIALAALAAESALARRQGRAR
jgi:Na+-translocating ferredoxin:NAD+ oxidoreductase RnfE subunit